MRQRRRLPKDWTPDTETQELIEQFRRATTVSKATATTLESLRVTRTRIINQLRDRGLPHRRIAAEVGLSEAAIARLMTLPTTTDTTEDGHGRTA